MDFARELLCEVVQEVQPLLVEHWRELTVRKDLRKLNPQWDQYALLEQMGRYVIFTLRDSGALVGYSAFHVVRHLQDAEFSMAQNDVIYVAPQHRNGIAVRRFLRKCESSLREIPVKMVSYFTSPGNNLAPILRHLGYADEQTMMAKYF